MVNKFFFWVGAGIGIAIIEILTEGSSSPDLLRIAVAVLIYWGLRTDLKDVIKEAIAESKKKSR